MKFKKISLFQRIFKRAIGIEGRNAPPRFRVVPAIGALGVTALGLWIYFRSTIKSRQEALKAKIDPKQSSFGTPNIGGHFSLIDHNSLEFDSQKVLNNVKYALVYFGFTHCPDICPMELESIGKTVNILNGKNIKILPIFITCDPERDGPQQLKEYLKDFDSSFVGLTGTADQISKIAKMYRVYYKSTKTLDSDDYLIDHSIYYFLIGEDGQMIRYFGKNTTPEKCAHEIEKTLKNKQE